MQYIICTIMPVLPKTCNSLFIGQALSFACTFSDKHSFNFLAVHINKQAAKQTNKRTIERGNCTSDFFRNECFAHILNASVVVQYFSWFN